MECKCHRAPNQRFVSSGLNAIKHGFKLSKISKNISVALRGSLRKLLSAKGTLFWHSEITFQLSETKCKLTKTKWENHKGLKYRL
jgi:hypothetical protein